MKKATKIFMDVRKELDWLAKQEGWKLIHTNGVRYTFVESDCNYIYEYIFFRKSKKELKSIRNQMTDSDIEYVCHSSTWALFRKDRAKGKIHVFQETSLHQKTLKKLYNDYMGLGVVYFTLAITQSSLKSDHNNFYIIPQILFYICSLIYYFQAYYYKKYSKEYS